VADDLGNQLDIQNQINSALMARAGLLRKQSAFLEGQVLIARELCNAMKCESLDGMDDRLGQIKSSMEQAANEAERMPQTLDSSAQSAQHVSRDLTTAGAAAGALKGSVDGVQGSFLTLRSIVSGFTGIVKGLGGIVSAVYGVWGKLTGKLIAASVEAAQRARDVALAYEELRDTFGDLSTGIGQEAVDAVKQFDQSAAAAGVNTGRFFAKFSKGTAEKIKAIGDAIAGMGDLAVGPLAGQIASAALEFTILQKGAGLSGEALQSLGNRALNAGQSLKGVMEEAARSIMSTAKAIGVSAKSLGKNFDAIAKNVVSFGHLSVKEMTKLSAVMTKTGISMSTVQKIGTQFDDFESGAQSVAKLTQAFGMQLDAVKMLNASDEDRLAMMKSSFQASGKSIDQLTRQERAYLANAAGIEANDLERVFGDQAAGIEETKTAAEKAADTQMDAAKAMQEMAKSIKTVFMEVKSFTSFFGAFFDGLKEGFLNSGGGLNTLYAALEKVFQIGVDLGAFLGEFSKDAGLIDKVFDLEFTIDMFQLLSDSIKGLMTGTLSLGDVFTNMFDMLKPKIINAFSTMGEVFAQIFDFITSPPVIEMITNGISALMAKMAEVLSRPEVYKPILAVLGGIGALLIGKAMFTALTGAIGGAFIGKIASFFTGGGGADVPAQVGMFGGMVDALNKLEWSSIGKAALILAAIAGLTAGGVLLFALALEKAGSMVTMPGIKKGAFVMGTMVMAMLGMIPVILGALALGAIAASGYGLLLIGAGLLLMSTVMTALVAMVPAIVGKIIEATKGVNPKALQMKIGAVSQLIVALTGFAQVFADIAGLAGMVSEGTDLVGLFRMLDEMFMNLLGNMRSTIVGILQRTKDFTLEDLQKVEVVGSLIDSMAGLMGGMAGPMEALKTKTEGFFKDKESIDPAAIRTFGKMVTGVINAMRNSLPGIIRSIQGIKVADPEALAKKAQAVTSVVGAISKLADIDVCKLNNIGPSAWAFKRSLSSAGRAFRGGASGPLAIATALVADYNAVTDELRKFGEGGMDLTATIDKIEKGITTKKTKIVIDRQKIQFNVNLEVKLEADKLAKALSDKSIVDQKLVLARAGTAQ
tara:strand:- start:1138 stop:4428 length:3291 start_codon:yes stop_codon:yes gene_type:complete